ncbi:MAG: AAA family ATPase [Verrucomicrobiota bacterium]
MNTFQVNRALAAGDAQTVGILPKLDRLSETPVVFDVDFGLRELPAQPGIIIVRGPRQYGKSTWLQQQVRQTIETYGPGSAFQLTGDEIPSWQSLTDEIRTLLPLYRRESLVRRLFIDEITAVKEWERALKILSDAGEFEKILVVTTGSKAADLRRGAERLPGRKGKLPRTNYIFTPLSYSAFVRGCTPYIEPADLLSSYILSGGAPVAASALAAVGHLPEYVIELVRDWVLGEFAASGRSRSALLAMLDCLYRFGGTPLGQSKLARETGLANNTVAAGYIELLHDLLAVVPANAWDAGRARLNRRKPCKYHFTNLLVAVAWHPQHPRMPADLRAMPSEQHGALLEWAAVQEHWRRECRKCGEVPETVPFWQSDKHELDIVASAEDFIEIKRGTTSPLDFAWFPKVFPKRHLTVVSASRYETDQITGVTFEDFLRAAE